VRDLREIQVQFQNYLLERPSAIAAGVDDEAPVSADLRLTLYRDSYIVRLLESLEEDYPVLYSLLGENLFRKLSSKYIQCFPSTFCSLNAYGKTFPDFLRQQPDLKKKAYLAELTEFEQRLLAAFDAADSTVMTLDTMAAIPHEAWPDLCFHFHPSLQTITLTSNAVRVWESYQDKGECISLQHAHEPLTWAIWRKEHRILFESLSTHDAAALECLCAGRPFSAFCEAFNSLLPGPEIPLYAASLLKRFVVNGWMVL
jgi:hypothetical protein